MDCRHWSVTGASISGSASMATPTGWGVIDERGDIVWGDRLLIVLARDLLQRQPGAAVICDVKCSQVVMDDVSSRGGRPIMWKTGHSLIKQKMFEEDALLAGEMSGHLFFAENFFGHDDAIYAGAKLLEICRGSRPDSPICSPTCRLLTPRRRSDATLPRRRSSRSAPGYATSSLPNTR